MKEITTIGMDEVGRGALSGPVITGTIVLPVIHFDIHSKNGIPTWSIDGIFIRDSKLLSESQRNRANEWLLKNAISYGIGTGSVSKINKKGIVYATNFAFRSAIRAATQGTPSLPNKLLIDAFYVPNVANYPKSKQQAIVHGDRLNVSIAAASIIAKVYRDTLMKKLGNNSRYREYLWSKNKGYGTREHINAIKKFGVTKHHRTLFVRNCLEDAKL